jgi:nitroreductase
VFVLFPDRATAKYGERGGRFALIEVGHAAQNLALRLVAEGMAGCEAGGLLDEPVKALLRLDGTGAQVALGYACGLPEIARRRGPFSRRRA